jgi:hypothetical protein
VGLLTGPPQFAAKVVVKAGVQESDSVDDTNDTSYLALFIIIRYNAQFCTPSRRYLVVRINKFTP